MSSSDVPTAILRVELPGHVLDLAGHALMTTAGERIDLRPQALEVLCHLASRPGRVVTKSELLDAVWPGVVVTDDSLVQAVGDARRAIGDDGHHLIQTVPRRGYRFVAPAVPGPDSTRQPAEADAGVVVGGPGPTAARRRSPWQGAAVLAGLFAISVAVAIWAPWRTRTAATPAPPAPDRPPIAVLDFRDAQASSDEQLLARGFAEELVGELARNADLRVIAAQSSFKAIADGDDRAKIAERLGARYLVDGSLRREGEQLRLTVSLTDARDGRVVWTERHAVGATEVYGARDAVVQHVAATLHATMRHNEEELARRRPPASLDVYGMTLRAMTLKHRFTPEASREAKALLEKVVALDPQYAPGWLYLGFVNLTDASLSLNGPPTPERYREAIGQLEHSIQLNPHLPTAYFGLGYGYSILGRPEDSVRAARLRVELCPSDSECHSMLGPSLVFAGRPAEALPHTRLVLERDPLPPGYVLSGVGLLFWANGRNDEAIEALDRCLEQSPLFILCRINRVVSLVEAGRLDAARGGAASRLAGSARGRCKALRRRRRDRAATRPARAPGSCA